MKIHIQLINHLAVLVVAGGALLMASCSSASLVNKPAVNEVKRLAVISITANRGMHPVNGGNSEAGSLMAMASFTRKKPTAKESHSKEMDLGGFKLVNTAVDDFTTEFGKVKGWEVVHPSTFWNSPRFASFRKDMQTAADHQLGGAVGALQKLNLIHAANLPRMPALTPEVVEKIKTLCADEHLDAVAIVGLDIAYDASFAIGGSGTAHAAVGVSLQIINRDGKVAASTANYGNANTFFRKPSDSTTAMAAGQILYTPGVEKMFLQSIHSDAVFVRKTINEQI